MSTTTVPIRLKSAAPILAVSDLAFSIQQWREQLGFGLAWIWGEPGEFAAVHRDEAWLQLKHNPAVAARAEGQEVEIWVCNIKGLYAQHQQSGAEILLPLQPMPWGAVEYVVREANGYYLRFKATQVAETVSKTLPPSVRIVERAITLAEYIGLSDAVGWRGRPEVAATYNVTNSVYSLIAEDEANSLAVGCLLLMRSGRADYYLESLIVHPDWQGRHIGTSLMERLMEWLRKNAAPGASVELHTDESKAPFYDHFGFTPHFGMSQRIRHL